MKHISVISESSPMWKYYNSKKEVHELISTIKTTKKRFKTSQASGTPDYFTLYKLLDSIKAFRILHIARSMFKGKEYNQIEKPRDNNKLKASDWVRIHATIDHLRKKQIEENL